MKKATQIVIFMLLFLTFSTFAQEQVEVKGVVTSDSEPLPGVSIRIKGRAIGTETDFNGNYSIRVPKGATLVFSYLGMKPKEIKVGNTLTINVDLKEDSSALDEVIIVAYGTAKKTAFTGSATQINAATIEKRPLTNVFNALDGASAGVKLSPANGQPGSSPAIRIRGIGSISASNSPLIIVDGVEYTGSFSSINSNDIESLTVLKDAASTSLYGSRAANGVVMITTKRGKRGKESSFKLDVSQGLSTRSIKEYKRVNTSQYYPLMWEALRNGYITSGAAASESIANQMVSSGGVDGVFNFLGINPFNVDNNQVVLTDGTLNSNARLRYAEDLDWQAPIIRAGSRENINFSYSGANETTDYFASLSYLKDEGYIIKSNFERITARINTNTKLKDWFKTGINLFTASSSSSNANDGGSSKLVNPFRTTRYIAPIYPVHLHNPNTGAYILDDTGRRQYDSSSQRIGSSSSRHVIQETLLNSDIDNIFSINGRTYAEFNFLNDFTLTVNAALDKRFFKNKSFGNPVVGDAFPDGRLRKSSSVRTTINYNQLLKYDKEIGKHNLSILLGHETTDKKIESTGGTRRGFIIGGLTEFDNFETITSLSSGTSRLKIEGYFSNFKYNFDKKYYVSASFRRDGSSRFINNKWGDFYSLGASWRIDQESFISNLEWINNLKIRASYGEVGNEDLGSYYIAHPSFDVGFNNQSDGGILYSSAGNPDLTWEKNKQIDVALEFGLFNNKISGTIEYYNRKSEDLLFNVPLVVSSGLSTFPDNIGDMTNSGLEVDLSAKIIDKNDFNWRLNINGATINNTITRLPQEELINGTKKLVVGGDIYAYWLRDWYGVDPADGSALFVLDPAEKNGGTDERIVGDTEVTIDHNKALRHFAGSALPDLYGAFTNTFSYKGIELGFTFTYQIGGKTYDSNYVSLMHSGTPGTALSTDILNRWQKPGDITNVPRLDNTQINVFGASSDRWLVDSDYLALRQISLAYSLPSIINQKLGIHSSKVYVNGENLFLSNKRQGMESGQSFNGTTSNRFTPSRLISLGFKLTF